MRSARTIAATLLTLALAGCASFAEGVTRAVMAPDAAALDSRRCEIEGPGFPGVLPALERQAGFAPLGVAGPERPILKVLMVHGIGTHMPGYGATLENNLAQALDLGVSAPQPRQFELTHPSFPDGTLGELRVSRHSNVERTREMLFYELTWSRISDSAKLAIAFDDTETHTRRRAGFNRLAKSYVNDVAPDPLVYVGVGREPILTAVMQSICWMSRTTWSELPNSPQTCSDETVGPADRILYDDLVFVSHSLGSRIVMDALQRLPAQVAPFRETPAAQAVLESLRNRSFPVFMLSNQLPLLQAGFAPPAVTGAIAPICRPEGARQNERLWGALDMVAFSDPNDLASYPIPDEFVQNEIDSRLCPVVTNVTLNVAPVRSVFGAIEVANPLAAHSTYSADDRVVALLARGLGQPWSDPMVTERCEWQKTGEDLR